MKKTVFAAAIAFCMAAPVIADAAPASQPPMLVLTAADLALDEAELDSRIAEAVRQACQPGVLRTRPGLPDVSVTTCRRELTSEARQKVEALRLAQRTRVAMVQRGN